MYECECVLCIFFLNIKKWLFFAHTQTHTYKCAYVNIFKSKQ